MDYKSMFEQAVRTLASIDDALGIGDDGCADPDMTLTAISELKAAAQRGEALARTVMADKVSDDSGVASAVAGDDLDRVRNRVSGIDYGSLTSHQKKHWRK